MVTDQGEPVQRAKGLDADAQPGKASPHDEIAPAFRQAVRKKAVQTLEPGAACRVKPGFRRIEQGGDRQGRCNELRRPLQLGPSTGHGEAADGQGRPVLVEDKAGGKWSSWRKPHGRGRKAGRVRGARTRRARVAAPCLARSSSRLLAAGRGNSSSRASSQRRAMAALTRSSREARPSVSSRRQVL